MREKLNNLWTGLRKAFENFTRIAGGHTRTVPLAAAATMGEHQELEIDIRLEMARFIRVLRTLQSQFPIFGQILQELIDGIYDLLKDFRETLASECRSHGLNCAFCR